VAVLGSRQIYIGIEEGKTERVVLLAFLIEILLRPSIATAAVKMELLCFSEMFTSLHT
jgi:hypothetical protein